VDNAHVSHLDRTASKLDDAVIGLGEETVWTWTMIPSPG